MKNKFRKIKRKLNNFKTSIIIYCIRKHFPYKELFYLPELELEDALKKMHNARRAYNTSKKLSDSIQLLTEFLEENAWKGLYHNRKKCQ